MRGRSPSFSSTVRLFTNGALFFVRFLREPLHEGDQGPPVAALSQELVEALTAAWPDLQRMLDWWRIRQQYADEAGEKLERVTYHVAPRWIEAVRREADLAGESYAAVVNRAFRQYFEGKST